MQLQLYVSRETLLIRGPQDMFHVKRETLNLQVATPKGFPPYLPSP